MTTFTHSVRVTSEALDYRTEELILKEAAINIIRDMPIEQLWKLFEVEKIDGRKHPKEYVHETDMTRNLQMLLHEEQSIQYNLSINTDR